MNQTGTLSAFFENILDSLFLTKSFMAADEFDLEIRLGGQSLCVVAYIIS